MKKSEHPTCPNCGSDEPHTHERRLTNCHADYERHCANCGEDYAPGHCTMCPHSPIAQCERKGCSDGVRVRDSVVRIDGYPRPWRVGRKVGRTIYDADDNLIGVMDTPDLARFVCMAVNEHRPEVDELERHRVGQ